jgi:serine/threonine protein kinase/tetratricopeptide (TPR) repeat protein
MVIDEKAVFVAALELPDAAKREAYLQEACAGRPELLGRLRELLAAHEESQGPLDHRPAALGVSVDEAPTEGPGSVLGPYKLLEQIGEGGMGLVFMAEQAQPVRRKVALKILKPGMDTRQVVARFAAERQALALMDHPHIAHFYDAGTTATGRPYFVMELVRGVPITEFCDQRRLTPRQRLELFVTVCQAVQHAHQKGIIHRDLKPSNVLVTLHDTVAVPKVIDFGIAKATTGPLTERTLFTGFAQLLGTPLYLSPEQAEMSGLDVDTRSDVYALGVMLYELLTGTTPFASETLRKAGYDELRRIIREEEPPRPSQRVTTLAAEACTTVAERRGVDGRRLRQLLRGELDWIVLKALEKDRNRRYESASALAADVQRYLHDEPVEACPPSAAYRLRKFGWRYRRAIVTAGVIAVVLIAATAVSIWQALKARDAGERATREANNARAVNEFLLQDLLRQVDVHYQLNTGFTANPNLTVKEALDRAAAKIGERFQDQPESEAAIRMAIGHAYAGVGDNQLQVLHMERALALRKAHLENDHPDTLESMQRLGIAYGSVGRFREEIALQEQALEKRAVLFGPDHRLTLSSVSSLVTAYRGVGQWDRAIQLGEEALEKQRAVLGPDDPATLNSIHSLALNYSGAGRYGEAIPLFEQALQKKEAVNGPDHPNTVWCLECYAVTYQRAGKLVDAGRLLHIALERRRKLEDPEGKPWTANTLTLLGHNLILRHRYADAEPLLREALTRWEKNLPEGLQRFYTMSLLGDALLGQQNFTAAEPLLLQGYKEMEQRKQLLQTSINALPEAHAALPKALARIVRFYELTQQPEQARLWREKLASSNHPRD